MTPFDLILWALAGGVSLVLIGMAAAIGWLFIAAARKER